MELVADLTAATVEAAAALASADSDATSTPRLERPAHACRSRQEGTFRDLVEQHRHRLYRFVLRHIGDATEAEDLAQQAFVEAARVYASFRGDSMLSTWLYGIAMNLVRNHLSRAPQRRYQFEDDSALEDQALEQADPEQQLALTQRLRGIRRPLAM